MQRLNIEPRPHWQRKVSELGLSFHTIEQKPYWDESAYFQFTLQEIEAIECATNTLYQLCLEAIDYVIKHKKYNLLAIPAHAVLLIEQSWQEREPTLYGRFDLAYDGQSPPKMLEFNADTPTSLLETAVIQWHWLNERFAEYDQFNLIHEHLLDVWPRIIGKKHETVYFASCHDHEEDFQNAEYLRDTCLQAGFQTASIDISDIGWHSRAFVDLDEKPIRSLFKLYPWEWLAQEKFFPHVYQASCQWIEPAWKMLLSNKAILAILWELFPEHPNLLPTYFTNNKRLHHYVRKPLLGREGANISVVHPDFSPTPSEGPYGNEGYVYQAFHPLARFDEHFPVIGSWLIGDKASGIGIREDRHPITGNLSRFIPHMFIG